MMAKLRAIVPSSLFVLSLLFLMSLLFHEVVKNCADRVGQQKVRLLACFKLFVLGRKTLNEGKGEKSAAPSGFSLSE